MSADNQILVLHLPDGRYYVAEVQASENAYFFDGSSNEMDPLWYLRTLLNAKIFNTKEEAAKFADDEEDNHYVEYGQSWEELKIGFKELIEMIEGSYFKRILGVKDMNDTEAGSDKRMQAMWLDHIIRNLTSSLSQLVSKS